MINQFEQIRKLLNEQRLLVKELEEQKFVKDFISKCKLSNERTKY